MAKKLRRPIVLKRSSQIKNTRSLRRDRGVGALAPGKRKSKAGKIYFERRSNRSDISRRLRL